MALEEQRTVPESCRIEISGPNRGVAHVALGGELDMVSAPDVERCIAGLLAAHVAHVVVHLDGLTFVDSAGLRALLAVTDAAGRSGATLRLLPGAASVMSVVEAAGLLGRLPFAANDQP